MTAVLRHRLAWPVAVLLVLLLSNLAFTPSFFSVTTRGGHLYGSLVDILRNGAPLGGVLCTFYTMSRYGLNGVGLELDAIAAVVIGGTLLSGGSGYVLGSVLGVLVMGFTQTIITFQGTLSSWWTRIVIALLLFAFILLQRLVFVRRRAGA